MQQSIVNQAAVNRILKTLQVALINPTGSFELNLEVIKAKWSLHLIGSNAGLDAVLENRARIGAAKKAWWAKQKGKPGPKKSAAVSKKSTGRKPMSAAMRKKLSAMMKARWAA